MKLPKSRGDIYAVVRSSSWDGDFDYGAYVVAVLPTYELAEEFRGACEQQWIDRVGSLGNLSFEVQITTFYG